jgi:hypothetical protein
MDDPGNSNSGGTGGMGEDEDEAVLRYKKMVVDLNLALFLQKYSSLASQVQLIRPLFIRCVF